jgi:hypothetical protein
MPRSVLQRVMSRLRPASIAAPAELKTFLQERASLIAQKCAIDYCRGKTGLASYALFTEKPFLDALDVCRWEAFAAVLGDLFILAEAHLRAHASAAQRPLLADALVRLHSDIFDAMPAPAHRPGGWADALASFEARLRAAAQGAAPNALDVADHSAKRLFDTLPIHSSYRELDEEVVYGAVRFRMIAVNQDLQRRIAAAELIRELLA